MATNHNHVARTTRRPRHRRRSLFVVTSLSAALALSGCVDDGPESATGPWTEGGSQTTIAVELGDIWVRPASIEVPAGSVVVLDVVNKGVMPHDLAVNGTDGTRMLGPGEREQITIGPFGESTVAWCTVPGHREAGMELAIVVMGGTDPGGGVLTAGTSTFADDSAVIDMSAAPEADWKPFDPSLAPAPGGSEHEITLEADEIVMEVAPGVTQEMWVFGGTFPGPVLRGRVGDLFTVTLVNRGDIGHSIDFHASKVAWNDEMRTIAPGESLVYQFEAKHAGIYMYHCGTAPALHHIGNGMFGAIIIDPPELAAVDHEFVFVQSEIYTGPLGAPGSLTKMVDDDWDAVVFNGYVNQYLHAPIRVETGERVRAWVLDAGPSENSAFHVVGTIFDTVFKEGATLLTPDSTRGGAQALDLQPSQGGYVEFTFDEDGLYPIVTHKFSNVGKGALGLFQAGEVDAGSEGGH
jgi:nitrite reductase (NO-forming)